MSLSIETIASRISSSTSFSGRWSLISWCVRKPRVLPILMSVFSSWRRLATSSSVSAVSSRPNSRISARSLARETFMRSGLALASSSASTIDSARLRGRPRARTGRRREASGLARLVARPCPCRRLALGRRRPCPWPALDAWATRGLGAAALAGFLASSAAAAFAGLAAGAALGGAGFLAVMRFLGWWWACGSAAARVIELRTVVRNSRSGRSSANATNGSRDANPRVQRAHEPVRGDWRASSRDRLDAAVLAGKVALWSDPRSEGGRGPEVLLSLLPRSRKPRIIPSIDRERLVEAEFGR